MLLSLKIALRYLLSRSGRRVGNAVNVISIVATAGVATATAAIVVVMSVFNGFTWLAESHLSRIDPELKIVATHGKVMPAADSLAAAVEALPGVAMARPTLTERALLDGGDGHQMPVHIMGVTDEYPRMIDADGLMLDGWWNPESMQISVGVAMQLGLRPDGDTGATVYVPRRRGRINPANPATAFRSYSLPLTGVFRVDQAEYDGDFVIIPLDRARTLLDYRHGEASAIEVMPAPGTDTGRLRSELRAMLPPDLAVLTRLQQQSEIYRMMSAEKWVTFLMLAFILIIASFNIVSTLSLLVIEKRDNMNTLRSLGAPMSLVHRIFMWEGALITLAGGIAGIIIGVALSLVQQHFGIIKLGGDPTTLNIDYYPVVLQWSDTAVVMLAVVLVALLTAAITRTFRTTDRP